MVFSAYKKALGILFKKPFRLWGLSLMGGLLTSLACVFGMLPIIVIPIVLVLGFGMIAVYYKGFHGEEVNSDLLFSGFRSFWKTAGTMGWQALWMFIWSPVPVMNIIKMYAYRFVPYLLLTRSELTGTQALRVSMEETKGYRWKLFGADILAAVMVSVAAGILLALAMIPYVGILFDIILFVFVLLVGLVFPLFMGLVQACMFDAVQEARAMEASRPKGKVCPGCGNAVPTDAKFCANCGFNFVQPPVYAQPQQPQYQQPVYQQPQYQPPVYPQQPVYPPVEKTPEKPWGGQSGEYQPPQQG